nr:MAG TPA: hypothetical protein [Bacteriophage sp.]
MFIVILLNRSFYIKSGQLPHDFSDNFLLRYNPMYGL